jgi:hypothetical protein
MCNVYLHKKMYILKIDEMIFIFYKICIIY